MSYRHFSIEEREIIALRLAEGENPTQIAKKLGQHHSSVLDEIRWKGTNFSKITSCHTKESRGRTEH